MSAQTMEERLTAVETKLEQLEREKEQKKEQDKKQDQGQNTVISWWEQIRGQFKDDPDYLEAMRLGREYRESLRPTDDEEV